MRDAAHKAEDVIEYGLLDSYSRMSKFVLHQLLFIAQTQ